MIECLISGWLWTRSYGCVEILILLLLFYRPMSSYLFWTCEFVIIIMGLCIQFI